MSTPGALSVGRPITVSGAVATVVLPRSGQLLGFFASATQVVTLNDAATTGAAGAGNQILGATVIAVGWNPFPVDFVNGLVATLGTGNVTFVIV